LKASKHEDKGKEVVEAPERKQTRQRRRGANTRKHEKKNQETTVNGKRSKKNIQVANAATEGTGKVITLKKGGKIPTKLPTGVPSKWEKAQKWEQEDFTKKRWHGLTNRHFSSNHPRKKSGKRSGVPGNTDLGIPQKNQQPTKVPLDTGASPGVQKVKGNNCGGGGGRAAQPNPCRGESLEIWGDLKPH